MKKVFFITLIGILVLVFVGGVIALTKYYIPVEPTDGDIISVNTSPQDRTVDSDGDSFPDWLEEIIETDPNTKDTIEDLGTLVNPSGDITAPVGAVTSNEYFSGLTDSIYAYLSASPGREYITREEIAQLVLRIEEEIHQFQLEGYTPSYTVLPDTQENRERFINEYETLLFLIRYINETNIEEGLLVEIMRTIADGAQQVSVITTVEEQYYDIALHFEGLARTGEKNPVLFTTEYVDNVLSFPILIIFNKIAEIDLLLGIER